MKMKTSPEMKTLWRTDLGIERKGPSPPPRASRALEAREPEDDQHDPRQHAAGRSAFESRLPTSNEIRCGAR